MRKIKRTQKLSLLAGKTFFLFLFISFFSTFSGFSNSENPWTYSEETLIAPESKNHDPSIGKKSISTGRPPFCGIWGIWGGENVSAVNRPWFKGVVTTLGWKQIEPENGVFDWTKFDSKVNAVTSKGLSVLLMVYHGNQCPDWVYSEKGVPGVIITGEPSVTYPYYFHPEYKPLLVRMIQETARHIENYPPEIRKLIVGVQCPTGKSGDPQPYSLSGPPTDVTYAINSDSPEWKTWTIDLIKDYREAYKNFSPPFAMLFKGPNPSTHDWLLANAPDSWRKPNTTAQGYQLSGELSKMYELYPQTSRYIDGIVVRTRGELDNTEFGRNNWFNAAPVWNVYWTGLWLLNYGLDMWSHLVNVLEDERFVPAFTFYSEYAGYKDASSSPGAWIALRDGLDYMDKTRFPESIYGDLGKYTKNGTGDNAVRYKNIAKAFAPYGARLDDTLQLANLTLAVRQQKGLNDVHGNIWPGNYAMFTEQIDPLETSQGYWRVGSKEDQYGRFARSVNSSSGKNRMYFKLDDRFFLNQTAPHNLSIRVVYFDKGTGKWALIYDAVDNPDKVAQTITNTNTGEWKELVFHLNDARLGNQGAKNSDFGIAHLEGDETIFHMIELKRASATHTNLIQSNNLKVYPSITKGIINIETEVKAIHLYDMNGRTAGQWFNTSQIDISSKASGIYFLQLNNSDGKIMNYKIAKE